jgi:acyl carrier protein
MNQLKAEDVRRFLVRQYSGGISASGTEPAQVPDDFDFLLQGVIDSLGVLEMVGLIENEFQIELDLADLDAEQMTILGPLSEYAASHQVMK